MEDEDEEDDSEDAINEFDFLGSGEDGEGSPGPRRCATEGNPHELGELAVWPSSLRVGVGPGSPLAQAAPAAASCPSLLTGWMFPESRGLKSLEAQLIAIPSPFPGKSLGYRLLSSS